MNKEQKVYDLVIVGGGVSGTSLLYTLSKYSNLKDICLIEKYDNVGLVNSAANQNSQTLHFGDIETNYTYEKADSVKKFADMVKNYLHAEKSEGKLYSKYSKMVLAVGKDQCAKLRTRYESFKNLFPNLRLIERDEIGKIEPRVLQGRDPNQEIVALQTEDGYTVDFGALSVSFLENAQKINKEAEIKLNTKVIDIVKQDDFYKVITNKGEVLAKVVSVAAGGHSLMFAKRLGLGTHYSILSMAGSFFIGPEVLNGKVYTMQKAKLPFAAIHGDPDVSVKGETRFGPTAKAIFFLERRDKKSFWEYWKTFGLGIKPVLSILNILSDTVILKYLLKNFLYDIPKLGKYFFLKEIKKIVPEIKYNEITYAKGYGGTRPQTINNETKKLELGESKLIGDNIIFNITPSPGASTCLGNSLLDSKKIMEYFDNKFQFDEQKFNEDLAD